MVELIRSKADIKEIESLKTALSVLKERFDRMCPHLVDDERKRAAAIWEAAQFAHNNANPGEPGPIAVIARGMRDTEERMLVLTKADEVPDDSPLGDDGPTDSSSTKDVP